MIIDGLDPNHPAVRELVLRWQAAEIERKLKIEARWRRGDAGQGVGFSRQTIEYYLDGIDRIVRYYGKDDLRSFRLDHSARGKRPRETA